MPSSNSHSTARSGWCHPQTSPRRESPSPGRRIARHGSAHTSTKFAVSPKMAAQHEPRRPPRIRARPRSGRRPPARRHVRRRARAAISRFRAGKRHGAGGVPGGYSDTTTPHSSTRENSPALVRGYTSARSGRGSADPDAPPRDTRQRRRHRLVSTRLTGMITICSFDPASDGGSQLRI